MALLVPIIGFTIGAIFLKISRVVDPSGTHEGSAFAAAFIVLVLLANALVFFISGIIIKIVSFFKSKKVNVEHNYCYFTNGCFTKRSLSCLDGSFLVQLKRQFS